MPRLVQGPGPPAARHLWNFRTAQARGPLSPAPSSSSPRLSNAAAGSRNEFRGGAADRAAQDGSRRQPTGSIEAPRAARSDLAARPPQRRSRPRMTERSRYPASLPQRERTASTPGTRRVAVASPALRQALAGIEPLTRQTTSSACQFATRDSVAKCDTGRTREARRGCPPRGPCAAIGVGGQGGVPQSGQKPRRSNFDGRTASAPR